PLLIRTRACNKQPEAAPRERPHRGTERIREGVQQAGVPTDRILRYLEKATHNGESEDYREYPPPGERDRGENAEYPIGRKMQQLVPDVPRMSDVGGQFTPDD